MTEAERLARIADNLDALAVPHKRLAVEYGSTIAAVDATAYSRAAKAVRAEVAELEPLEEIRQLLDRASELADALTNAEPDHRHASRLSRISDGLDLARERLADCAAVAP